MTSAAGEDNTTIRVLERLAAGLSKACAGTQRPPVHDPLNQRMMFNDGLDIIIIMSNCSKLCDTSHYPTFYKFLSWSGGSQ